MKLDTSYSRIEYSLGVLIIIGFGCESWAQPAGTNCVPPPPGMVSWWRAEGTPNDSVGPNNGVISGGVTFVPGKVGQAFAFDGLHSDVRVPASSSLDVGRGPGLTIETWVNPADLNSHPIFDWSPNGAYGVHFWESHPDAGCVYANIVDTGAGLHIIQSAAGLVVSGRLQHLAVTYDKGSGMARLFLNGAIVAEQNLGTFTPLTYTDLQIGYRLPGAPFGEHSMNGLIDEATLYGRALDPSEILAIYNAGSAGKCVAPHAPIARNAFVKVLEHEVALVPPYRILDWCSSPDNYPLTISTVSPTSTHGASVMLVTNGIVYSTPTNYLGYDQFDYSISDGHGGGASASAVVYIDPRRTAAATLLSPRTITGGVKMNFAGYADRTYTIERAESLEGPWITVASITVDRNGLGTFTDPDPPAGNAYYRAVFR